MKTWLILKIISWLIKSSKGIITIEGLNPHEMKNKSMLFNKIEYILILSHSSNGKVYILIIYETRQLLCIMNTPTAFNTCVLLLGQQFPKGSI